MALSREERLARARAKAAKLREKSKKGGIADRMDWRPKAKIYLHPETEIEERYRVWFPKEIEQKEKEGGGSRGGRKKKKVANVPFNVSTDPEKDPFAVFRKALKANEDIDGEDVVLVVGSGRSKVELLKGEILGWEGYDYKKRLTINKDVVMAAMIVEDAKGKEPKSLKWEILAAAKTLGSDINKEIETEIDESGEEEGNPFFRPYPFIIKYDSSESGSDMYSARARPQEKPEEHVEKMFDEDCPDLETELKIDDVGEIVKLIRAALVVELDFVFDVPGKGDEDEDEEKESKAKGSGRAKPADGDEDEEPRKKRTRRRSVPKPDPKPEPEEEKSDAEPEEKPPEKEEEKPKTSRRKRKVKKEEPKKELKWEPAEGEDYDQCPSCKGPVPLDAMKCPHCGVEFAVDDDEPF